MVNLTVDVNSGAVLSFGDLLKLRGYRKATVRYLRHRESGKGLDLKQLWMTDQAAFDTYQSKHGGQWHKTLRTGTIWASFIGTQQGETMFVGLYRATFTGESTMQMTSKGSQELQYHYRIEPDEYLHDYRGRLFVAWGDGERTYVQRADRQEKPITEIRKSLVDAPFPGLLRFICKLSELATLPVTWVESLRSARGVYVLTCPREHLLYVGSASGTDGFFGRWRDEARDGHGGNVKLKSREHSDYQVSILEVAGSAMNDAEINDLEGRWKQKLQSREMGLNAN